MIKRLFSFFLFFAVLSALSFTVPFSKSVKTIIIDPGHGGADQGAEGLISTEAQLTLGIGKKVGALIKKELTGVNVLFTRETDIFPGNMPTKKQGDRYRADFANRSGADLFISVHINSSGKTPGGWHEKRIVGYDEEERTVFRKKKKRTETVKVPIYESFFVPNTTRGTETYIWTAKENSHKGEMVGQSAEFELDDDSGAVDNDPVLNALKLVYTKKYFLKSMQLAELVQQEFSSAGRINRGVKQRNEKGIWVLHATGMPSVLVEVGFITNKEEEEYMNSETGQTEIAGNIVQAVKRYIAALDNPVKNEEKDNNRPVNGVAVLLSEQRKKNFA